MSLAFVGRSWMWRIGWLLLTAVFVVIFCITQGWFQGTFIETIYSWRILLSMIGVGIVLAGIIVDPKIVLVGMIATGIAMYMLFP